MTEQLEPSIPVIIPGGSEENYDSVIQVQSIQKRESKDMLTITGEFLSYFDLFPKEGAPTPENKLGKDWIVAAYNKYVMAAKSMKAEIKASSYNRLFRFPNGEPAFIVIVGKPGQSVTTQVKKRQFTFPDFLACISIAIMNMNIQMNMFPAPLGMPVEHVNTEWYKSSGLHICGHSGLPSIAKFKYQLDKIKSGYTKHFPELSDLTVLGFFIDKRSSNISGSLSCLEAIARTCGVTADHLISKITDIKNWKYNPTPSMSRKTAIELEQKINMLINSETKKTLTTGMTASTSSPSTSILSESEKKFKNFQFGPR